MRRIRLSECWPGSSPRGRGTRDGEAHRMGRERFIPARAGNTSAACRRRIARSVHPRAGGEHGSLGWNTCRVVGSSPRGRGTLSVPLTSCRRSRFIPARAGNTRWWRWPRCQRSVHPRAGGEHSSVKQMSGRDYGSSPRGRGTHRGGAALGAHGRFIPARAGNTRPARARSTAATVHPRAGGEHPPMSSHDASCSGSSPRGRGTPRDRGRNDLALRFIPARAGNTRASTPTATRRPVHPRAGGEHHRLF